ncbi:NADPH-dependent oxidoreductase [Acidimicrobiaceae bacterium USS-CC1]|uniref:NADPH-dependent oxidoreductase n=1 Tax=Acidiferrimicrobium australe TaxID=2664430 RepID=A0ABW9QPY6_9ACTN|nr:NADPH-dependent oxidoreductase [Acidiferrimicrobium australe]
MGDSAVSVVVGNPKPGSRTLAVARAVAEVAAHATGQSGPPWVLDLADHRDDLLDFSSARIPPLVEALGRCRIAIVASPTYKATYSGLLKAFFDWVPQTGMSGVAAVPVMVAATANHALAVEVHLRPLLVEVGAMVPTRGIFFTEGQLADPLPVIERWLGTASTPLRALSARRS